MTPKLGSLPNCFVHSLTNFNARVLTCATVVCGGISNNTTKHLNLTYSITDESIKGARPCATTQFRMRWPSTILSKRVGELQSGAGWCQCEPSITLRYSGGLRDFGTAVFVGPPIRRVLCQPTICPKLVTHLQSKNLNIRIPMRQSLAQTRNRVLRATRPQSPRRISPHPQPPRTQKTYPCSPSSDTRSHIWRFASQSSLNRSSCVAFPVEPDKRTISQKGRRLRTDDIVVWVRSGSEHACHLGIGGEG
jgi:hypothetical protein